MVTISTVSIALSSILGIILSLIEVINTSTEFGILRGLSSLAIIVGVIMTIVSLGELFRRYYILNNLAHVNSSKNIFKNFFWNGGLHIILVLISFLIASLFLVKLTGVWLTVTTIATPIIGFVMVGISTEEIEKEEKKEKETATRETV